MAEPEPADALAALSIDSEGEASAVIVAIDEAVDAQRDLEHQLRIRFGTNSTDFRALLLIFRLRRRHIEVHPGDLARSLGVSSGTASQIIVRLSAAGLLVRSPDPSDARAGVLTLSDDAQRRLSEATRELRDDLDSVIDSLDGAERDRIIGLLEQVRDIFRAHR